MEEFFRKWHYTEKEQSKELKCKCGWQGQRKDTTEKWIDTIRNLAGWRGMRFFCPNCKEHLDTIIMSRS